MQSDAPANISPEAPAVHMMSGGVRYQAGNQMQSNVPRPRYLLEGLRLKAWDLGLRGLRLRVTAVHVMSGGVCARVPGGAVRDDGAHHGGHRGAGGRRAG